MVYNWSEISPSAFFVVVNRVLCPLFLPRLSLGIQRSSFAIVPHIVLLLLSSWGRPYKMKEFQLCGRFPPPNYPQFWSPLGGPHGIQGSTFVFALQAVSLHWSALNHPPFFANKLILMSAKSCGSCGSCSNIRT